MFQKVQQTISHDLCIKHWQPREYARYLATAMTRVLAWCQFKNFVSLMLAY